MTSTSKGLIWGGVAIAVVLFGVIAFGVLTVSRTVRQSRLASESRQRRLASVDKYIDELTEKRIGDPPEFLYHVEYRILKTPYPNAAIMQQRIGTADSVKNVGPETHLEWLGNPTSQPVLLQADFANDGKLGKLHYYYKNETIGRRPSEWEKEIEIKTPTR